MNDECKWCEAPLAVQYDESQKKSVCKETCLDGLGYQSMDYKRRCIPCQDENCRSFLFSKHIPSFFLPLPETFRIKFNLGLKCTSYDKCWMCKTGYALIRKELENRLHTGKTISGEQACVKIEASPDFLYVKDGVYEPCMEDCKKCTSAEDCQECEAIGFPGTFVFLTKYGQNAKTKCDRTCTNVDYRYRIEGAKEGEVSCLECSETTYLLEGSDPVRCFPCTVPGHWVDKKDLVCKKCGVGCASCTSVSECNRCSNPNHNIQSDGGCAPGCKEGNKEMVQQKPERRCVPCPVKCEDCDVELGCKKCRKGYYRKDQECLPCPVWCSSCFGPQWCEGCSNPNHALGTDRVTCSEKCGVSEYIDDSNPNDKFCRGCGTSECLECVDENKCLKCIEGLYPDGEGCTACLNWCKVCTGMNNCVVCAKEGYYAQLDGSCEADCSRGGYEDKESMTCKECPMGCDECDGPTTCKKCQPNWYVQLDGSCREDCNKGEFKEEESMSCKVCSKGCSECDRIDSCEECDPHTFDQGGGSCGPCPQQCLSCISSTQCSRCLRTKEYLYQDLFTCSLVCPEKEYGNDQSKRCLSCPDNCSLCNRDGCVECDPNYYLKTRKCRFADLVNYVARQVYDTQSNSTFTIELILEEQPELTIETYREFEKNMVKYEDKFNFELGDKTQNNNSLTFEVEKGMRQNQFLARISLGSLDGISIGDKIQISIQSFSQPLDPELTDKSRLFSLIQKSLQISLEVYKLRNEPLSSTSQSVADITYRAHNIAFPATAGLAIAFSIFSQDSDGTFLKFNQFLTLLKRIKLVNIFFGRSLEAFIEHVSGDVTKKNTSLTEENQPKNRLLEVSIEEDQKDSIEQESNASHGKLDLYQKTLFFEGLFMIKSLVFDISWVLKIIGLLFLKDMKKKQKVEKWKVRYLKYQRKVHHTVMMMGAMDMLFFGTRIVLHRRNTVVGVLVKGVCLSNISLLTLDLLEVAVIGINLRENLQQNDDGKNNQDQSHIMRNNKKSQNQRPLHQPKSPKRQRKRRRNRFGAGVPKIYPTRARTKSQKNKKNRSLRDLERPQDLNESNDLFLPTVFQDESNQSMNLDKDSNEAKQSSQKLEREMEEPRLNQDSITLALTSTHSEKVIKPSIKTGLDRGIQKVNAQDS